MSQRREFAYLTGIIALLASLIGAYVSFSKLLDWKVLQDSVLDTLIIKIAATLFLLISVSKFGIDALFHNGSSSEGKEAKSKH